MTRYLMDFDGFEVREFAIRGQGQKWRRFMKNVILESGFWEPRPTSEFLGQETEAARLHLSSRFDGQITMYFMDFDVFEVLEFAG